jgi:tetratricopeptide (TPR) repeat protein
MMPGPVAQIVAPTSWTAARAGTPCGYTKLEDVPDYAVFRDGLRRHRLSMSRFCFEQHPSLVGGILAMDSESAVAERRLILDVIRRVRGLTGKEFAAQLRIDRSTYSGYQTRHDLTEEELEELVRKMGYRDPEREVARARAFVRCNRAALHEAAVLPEGEPEDFRYRIAGASAALASAVDEFFRHHMSAIFLEEYSQIELMWGDALLARLRDHQPSERRAIVEQGPEFHRWGLVVRLCEESVRAAPDSAVDALHFAQLAHVVARLVHGDKDWRAALEAYALAFVGNALRVGNHMASADAAFERVAALSKAGAGSQFIALLDTPRLLDLEASLRRDQGRFREALDLLDRAFALCRSAAAKGRVLLIRAKTLEELEDYEEAIAALRQAEPYVEAARDLRLLWILKFDLLDFLHHVGRHAEAEPLHAEVREIAIRLGNRLDLFRLVWVEARCAACLGRLEEAVTGLRMVLDAFTDERQPYDAALAGLELAVLYMKDGQTASVRDLAFAIAWVFKAKGITREELASVALFCRAATEETITLEVAHRYLDDLKQAHKARPVRVEEL